MFPLFSPTIFDPDANSVLLRAHLCVLCVFSSHSFWTSSSLDVPAGVTQEEDHTGFFIHLLSAEYSSRFYAQKTLYCCCCCYFFMFPLFSPTIFDPDANSVLLRAHLCVLCVFSSHSFWTSSSLDVPAGVTQEEDHTGFFIHLLSAVYSSRFYAQKTLYAIFYQDADSVLLLAHFCTAVLLGSI